MALLRNHRDGTHSTQSFAVGARKELSLRFHLKRPVLLRAVVATLILTVKWVEVYAGGVGGGLPCCFLFRQNFPVLSKKNNEFHTVCTNMYPPTPLPPMPYPHTHALKMRAHVAQKPHLPQLPLLANPHHYLLSILCSSLILYFSTGDPLHRSLLSSPFCRRNMPSVSDL